MNFKTKILFLLIPLSLLLSGCGLWTDFTTYFNLYHNAKTLYYDAEELIIKERKDIFFVSEAAIPAGANQNLPKVIEKFSKLLQFHNKSSYVDDALFLIGKAFYYQKSYIKASRKFQELIATQPNSSLVIDATLWLGKSEMQMKKFDSGLKYLDEAKQMALKEKNNDILSEVYVEEVRYLKFQEKFAEAVQKLRDIVALDLSDELSAKALFETGELLFRKLDNPAEAATAYKTTLDFSPPFDVEYNSRLNYSICLREMGKLDESQANLEEMSREFKFLEKIDEIYLQKGLNLKRMAKYDEAYKQLYVLDTLAQNSVSSGVARFELGDMFENNLRNFDSAFVYYSKAEKSASTVDYVKKIKEKSALFKRYEGLHTNLYVYTRQLAYLADPIEFKKDSLNFYADSADARLADLFKPVEQLTDSAKRALDSLKAVKDSLDNLAKQQGGQPGGIVPDEEELVTGRPKGEGDPEGKGPEQGLGNQPVTVQKKGWAPVMPQISADSLKSLLSKVYFDLGNVFFGEIIIPDSSYHYYTLLLSEYPGSKFTGQALFSLASYYLDKNEKSTADSIFQVVYDNFQNESVVNLAADKLGKPKILLNASPADQLFEEAEKVYYTKEFSKAVQKYYSVFRLYPETFTAPKSLLAAGFVLENDLMLRDSAFAVYDTLVTRYPQTRFTNKIAPKVNFYKDERAKAKKRIDDSLKAIQDSITADSIAKHTPKIDSTATNKSISDSTIKESKEPQATPAPPEQIEEKKQDQIIQESPWATLLREETFLISSKKVKARLRNSS